MEHPHLSLKQKGRASSLIMILIVLGLVVFGIYYYSKSDPLKNLKVENNIVTVDVGSYVAKFSTAGDFQNTYMLFGGEHFNNKNLINPIVLSGLNINDAKELYAQYPDLHRCSSAGAPIAMQKIESLYLIPENKSALDQLKASVKQHDENFANKGDRVCVSLQGKTLNAESAEVLGSDPAENRATQFAIPPGQYYLISSSKMIDCKPLLEEPNIEPIVPPAVSQDEPETQDSSPSEIELDITYFFTHLSRGEVEDAYAYTTDYFKNDIPREDVSTVIDTFLSGRTFVRQEKDDFEQYSGWAETSGGGTKDAMVYEYYGTIYFGDGSKENFMVGGVKENGEWKIQAFGFKSDENPFQ